MKRRTLLIGLAALVLPKGGAAQARMPLVAVLLAGPTAGVELFTEELARLGWIEGRTVTILTRDAEGENARIPQLAREIVTAQPDVVVARTTPSLLALKELTQTIPIIAAGSGDPIALGLTNTLSRPSANVTGFAAFTDDLTAKRLEVLRRLRPDGRRVAVHLNPTNPLGPRIIELARAAAVPLGWEIVVAGYENPSQVLPALDRAREAGADAALVLSDPAMDLQLDAVIRRLTELRLPALFYYHEYLRPGALLVYGLDRTELWRAAANYTDRLLRGGKIADLPFVQPSRVVLGINLKTARAIGVTVPLDLLGRADEVIE